MVLADVTWDPVSANDATISTNNVTFTQSGFTGYARSTQQETMGDATMEITFKPAITGNGNFGGFGHDPLAADPAYNSISFYIYAEGSSLYYYQPQSDGSLPAVQISSGTDSWDLNTVFKMTMDTFGVVRYYKDGTLKATSTVATQYLAGDYYLHATGKNGGGCKSAQTDMSNPSPPSTGGTVMPPPIAMVRL